MTVANFASALARRDAETNRVKALDNDIYFPVAQVTLNSIVDDAINDNKRSAIIRTDTNEILGIHSKKYKLTPNEIVFDALDRALQNSDRLDLNGMTIDDKCAEAGSRTVRTYTLPEHNVEPTKDDVTEMRFTVTNSYDGSTNLNVKVGGYRLLCLNGMVSGSAFGEYRNRHTSLFSAEEMSAYLNAAVENFLLMGERWKTMVKTPVSDAEAAAFLVKFTGGTRLTQTLMTYYVQEKQKLGANQWALFNALTYWSTHEQVKKTSLANRPIVVVEREKKVGIAINSPLFLKVA
jgi:hypothetical protein